MADPWYASEQDPQVRALLAALASGQLSPGFASDIAAQFARNESYPNQATNIPASYRQNTAQYLLPTFGGDPSMNPGLPGYTDSPSTSHAETPEQGQEMAALTKEYPYVAPPDNFNFWTDAFPNLISAGAEGAGQGIGQGIGGDTGGQVGGIIGGIAGGALVGGGVGSFLGAAGGAAGAGEGAAGGAFASSADIGLVPGSVGAAGGGAGGAGAGAGGAAALEGGSFGATNPDIGIVPGSTASGGGGTFGNLGASNPITGAASDASSGSSTPNSTSGSPAFNPTTGVSGSPGSATGTPMDFTQGSPILDVASSIPPGTPAGMDSTAAANFAAENTANPALSATLNNTGLSGPGAGPAPGGGFGYSDILKFIKSNPSLLLGAGSLGVSALSKPKIPNVNDLNSAANATKNTADQLINSEVNGRLPPGMQSMVSNALNDTIAGIKAKYANMNLSGSSSEQQEIQAAQERAAATTAQLATTVTNQGLNAENMAAQIFQQIAQLRLGQDQGLQNAISAFAGGAGAGAGQAALRAGLNAA